MVLAGEAVATEAREPVYLIMLGKPATFSEQFPPSAPNSPRQFGWGIVLRTLKTPVAALRHQLEEALDTSEKTGYPLLIHLDDWNFPPPSADPDWVEWTEFPGPGETHGPLVQRRWLNWGSWMVIGPPPNYESQKFRAFMRSQIEEGVLRPLAERLTRWRKEGRERLFAGLVVGWESGYYSMTLKNPRPVAGTETFSDSEVVTTGYAALARRGYSAERLTREAHDRGLPEWALFRELMCCVVHDYVEYLCGICAAGGIPRERLYTHFAAPVTAAATAKEKADSHILPVGTAINSFARPGFTMSFADLGKVAGEIHKANGRNAWGAVEIEVVARTRTEQASFENLNWLTAQGARVLCFYGWSDPETSPFHIQGTGAVPAMQRWLREAPSSALGPKVEP